MLDKLFKANPETKKTWNTIVAYNYSKLKPSYFILPLFLLLAIVLFLFSQDALSVEKYGPIQKNVFLFVNSELGQFPTLLTNLTQLGDALICLSFLTLFIVYAPKIWESLLSASIVSAIFSNILKSLFAIPRPAATFDKGIFVIIGETLTGHNSLPSGHSITVFTVLSILMFAWMPKKWNYKILWCFFMVSLGLILVFTRVGVGAHFPLDVIVGSIIGYISGLIGIFITQKYKIWTWINAIKYYPIFMFLFLICCILLINKLMNENLIIYYLSFVSLFISLYEITRVYVKR